MTIKQRLGPMAADDNLSFKGGSPDIISARNDFNFTARGLGGDN